MDKGRGLIGCGSYGVWTPILWTPSHISIGIGGGGVLIGCGVCRCDLVFVVSAGPYAGSADPNT